MADSSTPNPTSSIIWFFIVTTLYTVAEYTGSKKMGQDSSGTSRMYFAGYVLLIIIGEFFVNLGVTQAMCGSAEWSTALMVTIFPWGFIFGILTLLLSMFPGWLSPFSNTFGYGVAILAGLNNILADILEPNPKGKKTPESQDMDEALAHIYSDKSLLVNEITVDNFDYFWDKMRGVFKKGVYSDQGLKGQLYSMIVLKDTVASYIWYLLAGLLITSVSYNYIVNTTCSTSAKDMQKRHDEYEQQLAEAQEKAQNAKETKRVYTSNE
uniref:Uncharacterized protein n=1 Tax=viral metagenome TaxID=1070528 RepID=A0A6C0LKJ5_9ZZZZ